MQRTNLKNRLAISGGEPVFQNGPPVWPRTTPAITAAVQQALAEGSWGKYESHWTEQVIATLSQLFGNSHVLLCSSGTIGVELALRGAGVKPNDEVILAGYDFPGNFRAIEAIGAIPVLVDVVKDGWVIDSDGLSESITQSTTAIIVSHLHGQIADIGAIRKAVANGVSETPVSIIEDNCQAPGGCVGPRPLGSLGDVGVLSFGGSKSLSAGRGGALMTNNAEIYQRAKIYANRGNDAFPLSQLQAAALLPQLSELETQTTVRNQKADMLIQATAESPTLTGLSQVIDGEHVAAYYKLPWLLANPTNGGWTREEFVRALQAEGVAIDTAFRGFARRTARRCRKVGSLVNSQIAAQQTILLHHPVLLESAETIKRVGQAINKVVGNPP